MSTSTPDCLAYFLPLVIVTIKSVGGNHHRCQNTVNINNVQIMKKLTTLSEYFSLLFYSGLLQNVYFAVKIENRPAHNAIIPNATKKMATEKSYQVGGSSKSAGVGDAEIRADRC